jgi:hypothetical protein
MTKLAGEPEIANIFKVNKRENVNSKTAEEGVLRKDRLICKVKQKMLPSWFRNHP